MPFEIYLIKEKLDSKVSGFDSLEDFQPRPKLVAEVIRAELQNYRQGNAHTKTRGEVRGGGKKPWRQKGTGRARHGSIRSPLWIGGGVTFGPRSNRNWHLKINKKAKLTALKSILVDKLNSQNVFQLQNEASYPKTKQAIQVLDMLSKKTGATKGLVVYTQADKATLNGFANTTTGLIDAENLKLSRLANSPFLILTPKAKEVLEARVSTSVKAVPSQKQVGKKAEPVEVETVKKVKSIKSVAKKSTKSKENQTE
jgi:large subunit ribosomal protein L4